MRLIIATVIATCWMVSSANAAIYKCLAADGAVSYSKSACPADATSGQVVKVYARPKSAGTPKPTQPTHTVPHYDHAEYGEGPSSENGR